MDLRPLNVRVAKQKFPFPIIEDCIARLNGSKMFTLLDFKDEFYQIKVHPDDTKYFSFATPDGQFEYTQYIIITTYNITLLFCFIYYLL